MSDWGFQSWNAAGAVNNYGIVPVSVMGMIHMNVNQQSGSWTFTPSVGNKIQFQPCHEGSTWTSKRRTITISGNTITCGAAGDNTIGGSIFPAADNWYLVYQVKA